MKKSTRNFAITGLLFGIFLIFTILTKFVDVDAVGPINSQIGFSTFNNATKNCLGYNSVWETITNILGFFVIVVAVVFAVMGLVQAVKHKDLKKVDPNILFLGAIYCLMAVFYMVFEYLIINYRPVLVNGVLEASYPSSHTLLAITILGTAIVWLSQQSWKKWLKISLQVFAGVLMTVVVVGRLISGLHWTTDIIAGIILGTFLVMFYISLLSLKKEMSETNR